MNPSILFLCFTTLRLLESGQNGVWHICAPNIEKQQRSAQILHCMCKSSRRQVCAKEGELTKRCPEVLNI